MCYDYVKTIKIQLEILIKMTPRGGLTALMFIMGIILVIISILPTCENTLHIGGHCEFELN